MMAPRQRVCWALPLIAGLAVAAACDNEKSKTAESAEDAGASKAPVDPALAAAVAAASARVPGQAAGSVDAGPPPNGIFAPGAADKELAKGVLPKLVLGGDGSEPRKALKLYPSPGDKATGTITLSLQNDPRQPALPIEFGVAFEARQAKTAAEDQKEPAGAVEVSVLVKDAKVALRGQVPEETDREIRKLKGSKIRYQVLPNGAGSGYEHETPKGLGQEFSELVRALAEALATLTLPTPDKNVGPGAFWMVTSRDGVWGLDLVTYRIIKLESVADDRSVLNVDVKRYAASTDFNTPSVASDSKLTLEEFESVAKGQLVFAANGTFPVSAQIDMIMAAGLRVDAQPNQQASVQSQTRVKLTLAKP